MSLFPIYSSFTLLSILTFLEFYKINLSYKVVFSGLIILCLVILATFRSVGVGNDDQAYIAIFESIPALSECDNFLCGYTHDTYQVEFGFFWFLSLLLVISSSQYWLFFCIALPSVYLNVKSIRFFSPFVGASSLVYFCHFFLAKEMNAIRIGLASAILFYAASYLAQCRYLLMFLLVLLACLFHVTSVIFLLPLTIYLIAPSRFSYALVGLLVLLISSFLDMNSIIRYVAGLGFGFVSEKLQLYLNADIYNYILPTFDIVNVRNLIIICFSIYYWERLKSRFDFFTLAFCFFYSATFFRIFFGGFAILAGRGYSVISMFEYILIPYIAIFLFGRKWGSFIVFLYAFFTLWINLTINHGWSGGVGYFHDLL